MEIQNWFVPITLLPGVCLFIIPTSNLTAVLGTEINELLDKANTSNDLIKKKIAQLKRLNIALTTLYVGAICFALSGFIGSLGILNLSLFVKAYMMLMIMGIALLIVAMVLMMLFAYKTIYNREQQFKEKMDEQQCANCGKSLS